MNISFEKTGNVSAVLTIKMEKADYAENVEKAIKNYSHKAQMPGFRQGKVPVSLVKKMYGSHVKAEEVDKLMQDSLFKYIKDNKIDMLGQPLANEKQQPQDIEKQDDFEFVFDIALAPQFKAELTAKDTVDYYDIAVDDEQVEAQVKQMTQRAGHVENVDSYADRDVLRGTLTELDDSGAAKEGGIVVEKASLMPTYFKSDEQKKLFDAAKKDALLTFNPSTAYENNDAEVAALLKIKKEEVGEHKGNFSFAVEEVSRFVPAEVNQALFDQVFGKDKVKSEEEFREKIKAQLANQHVADSDYKFLIDVRAYMEKKVGELEFPTDLLKRIMKANNADKDADFVDKHFDKSIEELKWHLIKGQLVEANQIKVEQKDVKAMAVQATRFQFAQYGMTDIPDEYLEQYAAEMLKKEDQRQALVERCIDSKLTAVLKGVVTLNHKAISASDFAKMFN